MLEDTSPGMAVDLRSLDEQVEAVQGELLNNSFCLHRTAANSSSVTLIPVSYECVSTSAWISKPVRVVV